MANNFSDGEDTELVDVSDVEPSFEDEIQTVPGGRDDVSESVSGFAKPIEPQGPQLANLRERFAALIIDLSFLYAIYWFLLPIYRAIAFESAEGPIPLFGLHGIIFHSIFLIIALIWFVIPEMALEASIGKLFCHIQVKSTKDEYPSFISILIRNITKPFDILLFPLLVPAMVLEWTTWQQRIGDKLAGTVVLKKKGYLPRQYALSLDMLSSTCARTVAFSVDFTFVLAFLFGLSLLLNPDTPLASMLIVVFAPLLLLLFVTVPEWITKTSPGKWLFGFVICHEEGSVVELPSALIRNIWRIFDTNPIGFLTSYFSVRKQRSGDTAAGTVVINAKRELRGAIGLLAIFIISFVTLYSGLQNRDSYLHGKFEVNFLPSIDLKGLARWRYEKRKFLAIENFTYAADVPSQIRQTPIFHPGETVFLLFSVDGYTIQNDQAWLQVDLKIRYPNESDAFEMKNINEFKDEIKKGGPISFDPHIALPANAMEGRYNVTLTVRDNLSRSEIKEVRYFHIAPAPKESVEVPSEKTPTPPRSKIEEPPSDTPPPESAPPNPFTVTPQEGEERITPPSRVWDANEGSFGSSTKE